MVQDGMRIATDGFDAAPAREQQVHRIDYNFHFNLQLVRGAKWWHLCLAQGIARAPLASASICAGSTFFFFFFEKFYETRYLA